MRRVAPLLDDVVIPRSPIELGAERTLFASTTLTATGSSQFASACLGCPDQPCARFTEVELARETSVESPYTPDPAVCPTYAISRGVGGTMMVDADNCLGCGLCVVRCPVGAVYLDPYSAAAHVERPSDDHYERVTMTLDEFDALRIALAEGMAAETVPFADAGRLSRQMLRAAPMVEGAAGQRVLRLLTRNTFLLSGAARLKNVGDNNAAAELLVDAGDDLLVVEVEPSTDVPDAVRRVLAGCAIVIARLGANRDGVAAAVVVPRLPNVRVEYYRVAQNVYDRLGIAVYGVPLALLLLGIRAGGGDLARMLRHFCYTDGSVDTDAVVDIFGDVGDPAVVGLAPPK